MFVPVDCISRLSGSVELTLRYTTPDIRCRHRRYECDGGIRAVQNFTTFASHTTGVVSIATVAVCW